MAGIPVHFDPEFVTFTYGDWTPPGSAKAGLRHLKCGELLVFLCGLEGWGFASPPALYIIGYFVVERAGFAADFADQEMIEREFGRNAHVIKRRHRPEAQWERLVLVKGGPRSRLLTRVVLISTAGQDKNGKPLKVLSPKMQGVFSDFGGRISIQRSSPRWVPSEYVRKAAAFVKSLESERKFEDEQA